MVKKIKKIEIKKDVLREAINAYLNAKRSHTLLSLARKAKVSYATVRRLAQGEFSASPQSAFNLVEVIMPPEKREQFLREYYPRYFRLMLGAKRANISVGDGRKGIKIERHRLYDDGDWARLVFCFDLGLFTKKQALISWYGERSQTILKEMVEQGVVTVGAKDEIVVNVSQEEIKNLQRHWLLKKGIGFIFPHLLSESGKSVRSGRINAQALRQLENIYGQCDLRVEKILENPENRGDIGVWVNAQVIKVT